MTKFSNAEDDGYDAVAGEIRRWMKYIFKQASSMLEAPRSM